MAESPFYLYGIRHHGPGSARSLCQALEALQPDCILVEGPPDAEEALPLALHPGMKPPVALLVYDAEKTYRSAVYPFAVFSPEWQAIQFGLSRKIPVRFMDLPQSVRMAFAEEAEAKAALEMKAAAESVPEGQEQAVEDGKAAAAGQGTAPSGEEASAPADPAPDLAGDPLEYLARAAGCPDSERWWEQMVEHRREGGDVFAAVLEAMTALREAALASSLQRADPENEARREAHMRQTLRAAQKDGFQRIAVVCGAWHAPALATMPPAKDDAALLKGLPKRKVAATWIPWTYSRLAASSGYGAGIESPGWYHFLFERTDGRREDVATGWLVKVARLLRGEDLDASSASVIEAVRLANSLAALRGRSLPGLTELNEAAQTVLCFGDSLPLQLIRQKLIVSDRPGEVPEETPAVPLARDLAREQKRLRLPPEAAQRQLDLDLRKPNDLDRSRLLHRLQLLGIPWGEPERQRGSQKGTFHEFWRVQWQPEFAVALVEASIWGNTIAGAASARVRHQADSATDLPALTSVLDATLLADLPEAAEHLMSRLQAVAAVASDVGHLMDALPSLANILRYGNVRQTDAAMVAGVVDGLVARICIGLPGACASLNDEAAEAMFQRLVQSHAAIGLLQNEGHTQDWLGVLGRLADLPGLHGIIGGRACRLLHEAQQMDPAEAARRLSLALSTAGDPAQAAAWVEGFLRKSGLVLLHDAALWGVLDEWITGLTADHFTAVLPLLRRTFSTFEPAERRQMGNRVASGAGGAGRGTAGPAALDAFDAERANKALPLLARLLGLKMEEGQ